MKVHDHRKIHKGLYTSKKNIIQVLEVPELQFIVTQGSGPKNVYSMHEGNEFWSINRVTNRLKEMTKTNMDYKFKLMPLEVVWSEVGNDTWTWTAMMQVPDLITQNLFEEAIHELEKRKRSVRVPVSLEKIQQGRSVQTLHLGPYHLVDQTINKLKEYCDLNGFEITTDFREIYSNAPFCNPPEKAQTIVRVGIR
ncbi:hypothetical protein [Fredinandcohnia sp. 179-A 10B2 NHS]|uniref:hypothetical protein n=1 Tax=Fredinandcohnia sp. 179-A 10B2 NHS TaxID=3235176 RepID=UPI0039A1A258